MNELKFAWSKYGGITSFVKHPRLMIRHDLPCGSHEITPDKPDTTNMNNADGSSRKYFNNKGRSYKNRARRTVSHLGHWVFCLIWWGAFAQQGVAIVLFWLIPNRWDRAQYATNFCIHIFHYDPMMLISAVHWKNCFWCNFHCHWVCSCFRYCRVLQWS